MKLILKNLKQVVYNIEIPSEKCSILELKKLIEKLHNFDASQLKLLHNGIVLDNSKTLEDYQIKENNIIIMMNTKVNPQNSLPPKNNESSESQKFEENKEEPKKNEQKKESEKKEQNQQVGKYSQQISSLIDMGFEKSQAEAAIKAAHGHIELAIEYLYNGIPEGDLNDLDIDVEDEHEHGEDEGDEGEDNDDDPVKNVASVAKILSRNNEGALSELLQRIQQNNPDLMNLIKEREDEFKAFLEEPINNNDYRIFQRLSQNMGLGGYEEEHQENEEDSGQIRINLTSEEIEAVKRLKELGNFSENDVVQAYFACEKNEELTANYLFEQKMNEDDEIFGAQSNNNKGNGQ